MTTRNPHTVLLVDDDRVTRLALSALARRIPGAEVIEAEDGHAAWEMLAGGLRPVACCTDLQMPRMGGVGLLRRTREHPLLAYLPVILVTGTADHDSVEAAIAHRAAGFIVKPFSAQSTRVTLERVIRECVLARAEPPGATRQRLQQPGGALRRMLAMLGEEIERVTEQVAADPGGAAIAACVSRLRGGCQTLGLWRAVQVCDAAWPVPRDGLELADAMREMAMEVRCQAEALRSEG